MGPSRRLAAAVAAASLSLAACSADDRDSSDPEPTGLSTDPGILDGSGGTITVLQRAPSETFDPQRMYLRRDLVDTGRLFYRSLVAFPSSDDPALATTPQPDLATDTGRPNADFTQWSFTLKAGVTWQDGRDITCEDLAYGPSRSFATDVITGGPAYVLDYLDIPTDERTGRPAYVGPYRSTPAQQARYDDAVTCEGTTITYRFKKPFVDFPLAIAALRCFDPYREDQDRGDRSNFVLFSNGPYLRDPAIPYEDLGGRTYVRNPFWDASTDPIRSAYPDRFVFKVGEEPETQYDRLIADQGADVNAITTSSAPPTSYRRIDSDPAVAERAVVVDSTFTDFVLPNVEKFESRFGAGALAVREALAVGADRAGYSGALGGERASKVATSIVAPSVPGYTANPAFADLPPKGDPAAAQKILKAAGVPMPVRLRFSYDGGGTPSTERAFGALIDGWNRSGFDIDVNSYAGYDINPTPDDDADLIWNDWVADWPSIGAVIPPLFDSRRALTSEENQGHYANPALEAAMDAAAALPPDAQPAAYAAMDELLGDDVAYLPLGLTRFYLLRGSNVDGYLTSAATSGYPDLAVISLKDPQLG